MYQVRYILHWSGNYHVKLLCIDQEICITQKTLQRILGIDYVVEVGCREISLDQCMEMGFIFPSTFSVMGAEYVI